MLLSKAISKSCQTKTILFLKNRTKHQPSWVILTAVTANCREQSASLWQDSILFWSPRGSWKKGWYVGEYIHIHTYWVIVNTCCNLTFPSGHVQIMLPSLLIPLRRETYRDHCLFWILFLRPIMRLPSQERAVVHNFALKQGMWWEFSQQSLFPDVHIFVLPVPSIHISACIFSNVHIFVSEEGSELQTDPYFKV